MIEGKYYFIDGLIMLCYAVHKLGGATVYWMAGALGERDRDVTQYDIDSGAVSVAPCSI